MTPRHRGDSVMAPHACDTSADRAGPGRDRAARGGSALSPLRRGRSHNERGESVVVCAQFGAISTGLVSSSPAGDHAHHRLGQAGRTTDLEQ